MVDFKTDRVRDEAALQQLLDKEDYVRQVQQYGTAVQVLLQAKPRLVLCFLNFGREVRVVTVPLMD